jgi:hypothetical protein
LDKDLKEAVSFRFVSFRQDPKQATKIVLLNVPVNCVIQVRSRGQKKHKSWGEGKKKRSDGMLRLC